MPTEERRFMRSAPTVKLLPFAWRVHALPQNKKSLWTISINLTNPDFICENICQRLCHFSDFACISTSSFLSLREYPRFVVRNAGPYSFHQARPQTKKKGWRKKNDGTLVQCLRLHTRRAYHQIFFSRCTGANMGVRRSRRFSAYGLDANRRNRFPPGFLISARVSLKERKNWASSQHSYRIHG